MLNADMMNGFLVVDNEKMSHIQFADLLNVEVPKPSERVLAIGKTFIYLQNQIFALYNLLAKRKKEGV